MIRANRPLAIEDLFRPAVASTASIGPGGFYGANAVVIAIVAVAAVIAVVIAVVAAVTVALVAVVAVVIITIVVVLAIIYKQQRQQPCYCRYYRCRLFGGSSEGLRHSVFLGI